MSGGNSRREEEKPPNGDCDDLLQPLARGKTLRSMRGLRNNIVDDFRTSFNEFMPEGRARADFNNPIGQRRPRPSTRRDPLVQKSLQFEEAFDGGNANFEEGRDYEEFVGDRPHQRQSYHNYRPPFQNEEHRIKIDIPTFYGLVDIEDYYDWECKVDEFFKLTNFSEDMKVKLVAYKFKGNAAAWWTHVKASRQYREEQPVRTWCHMKNLLQNRFLPLDHKYQQLQSRMKKEQQVNPVVESLLLASREEAPQQNNIFHTRCTIGGKICNAIIDNGCSENIVSVSLVEHLKLKTEPHPSPYRISWIKKGPTLQVTQVCKVPLSFGKFYKSEVLCDIVEMDTCHILLGRPWQFDVGVKYFGKENAYLFRWEDHKIVLYPKPPLSDQPKTPLSAKKSLCTITESPLELNKSVNEAGKFSACMGREVEKQKKPEEIQPLVNECGELFSEELFVPVCREEDEVKNKVEEVVQSLPTEFEGTLCTELLYQPPLQHEFNLLPPPNRLPTIQHSEVLQVYDNQMPQEDHFHDTMSSYIVLIMLSPKKENLLQKCTSSFTLGKISIQYEFRLPQFKEVKDQLARYQEYSKVFLKGGYNQFYIQPRDEWKTASRRRRTYMIQSLYSIHDSRTSLFQGGVNDAER